MEEGRRRVAIIALLAACGSSKPAPVGSRVGPALAAVLAAADRARAPWRCAAADGPELAVETLALGERTWKLAGHALALDGSGAITIGVIADAGGAAAPTLAAIGRLRGKLANTDLVLVLGGMGGTAAELQATLGALGDRATWPIVVVPGDLEPAPAAAAAIAALRARGQPVLDGRLIHRVDVPGATIAVLAGAGDASRLVPGAEGCGYRPGDVAAVFADLTPRTGLRILATAEAPRVTIAGEAAGDLALVPSAGQEIDITLHGPLEPAPSPARTGTRDGTAVPLSPGTSDAMPRLPGPRHAASAGLLTVNGNAWRWRPITDAD